MMHAQVMTQSACMAGSALLPARPTQRRLASARRMGIVAMSTRKVNTVDDGWKKVLAQLCPLPVNRVSAASTCRATSSICSGGCCASWNVCYDTTQVLMEDACRCEGVLYQRLPGGGP